MTCRAFFAPLCGLMMCLAAGCDRQEQVRVSPAVEEAFYAMFASNEVASPTWSLTDDGYFVCECRIDGYYSRVWFDVAGHWYLTETSDIAYHYLPKTVREHFESMGLKADEVYRLDYDYFLSRYAITTGSSWELYLFSTGDYLKRQESHWEPSPLPVDASMLAFVEENFSSPVYLLDARLGTPPLGLYLYEGQWQVKRYRAVYFDTPVRWLATTWQVLESEVPGAVLDSARLVAGSDTWEAVWRVDHQRVSRAYGFRLAGESEGFFLDDEGRQVDLREVPLE